MKWFTCTPIARKGNHTVFNQNSGLYCKTFQQLGIESKLVKLVPAQDDDWTDDIIRAEYRNLEDPAWWRSHQLDGVILYAWGKACYTPIAKAIHESGAKLVVYLDTGEFVYPWQNWWAKTKLILFCVKNQSPKHWVIRFIKEFLFANLNILNYPKRRKHFDYADLIGIPSAGGIENHKKVPFLFSPKSKEAVFLMPGPVATYQRYNGTPKENRVMAVGRWDDVAQKRPGYMTSAIDLALKRDGDVEFDIFGQTSEFLSQWHAGLPAPHQRRVVLHGMQQSEILTQYYRRASVCICPSSFEGTHNVSSEAVCNGASLVVANNPFTRVVQWYTTHDSGCVSKEDTPESFGEAIIEELQAWKRGERDPQAISDFWCGRLHAANSVRKILEKLSMAYEYK